MERLFKQEPIHKPIEEAIAADIKVRLEKLFKKYNYIEPKDLVSLIAINAVGLSNGRA